MATLGIPALQYFITPTTSAASASVVAQGQPELANSFIESWGTGLAVGGLTLFLLKLLQIMLRNINNTSKREDDVWARQKETIQELKSECDSCLLELETMRGEVDKLRIEVARSNVQIAMVTAELERLQE